MVFSFYDIFALNNIKDVVAKDVVAKDVVAKDVVIVHGVILLKNY